MKLLRKSSSPNLLLSAFVIITALIASSSVRADDSSTAEPLPVNIFKALQAGKKQTVVVYGTSLTALAEWPKAMRAYFEKQYPGQVTFVNASQSGQHSDWGVANLQTRVLSKNPDLVFMEFSINDAVTFRHMSKVKSEANLDSMVKSLREQNPRVDIVLMTMSPTWDTPQNPGKTALSDRPTVAEYYDIYRDYAHKNGLPLVDNYPLWLKVQQDDEEKFKRWLPDGTHPIAEGSLAVTWKAINDLLEKARTAATNQMPATNPGDSPK